MFLPIKTLFYAVFAVGRGQAGLGQRSGFDNPSAFSGVMQEIALLAKAYKAYQCLIDPLIFEENKEDSLSTRL